MQTVQLFHMQSPPFLEVGCQSVAVRLLSRSDSPLKQVWLRVEPDNEEWLLPMSLEGQQHGRQLWQAELPLAKDKPQTVYAFKVIDGSRQYWCDAEGTSERLPLRERFFRYVADFQPPDWVPEQVFYQIFPDRFCNGDPQISVRSGEYLFRNKGPVRQRQWGEAIDPSFPNGEFYGGDLAGIQQRLDHLQRLGITAIYCNPIFTSPSVHKYDCEDYYNVDPHLGGNQALASLVQDLHQRGMKILLDGVFNHTSDTHPWFNRWSTHETVGAYQDVDSPHRHYYLFSNATDPESYNCWKGSKVIPVLDFSQPQVRDYFYQGEDSVMRHWLREPYAVDGWRMDVIHMMGDGPGAANNAEHVRAMRAVMKQEDPQAYFLGEHFYEASRWLQGVQEDGAMNYYGFALPLRAFLAGLDVNYHPNRISAVQFAEWLDQARSRIPYANQLCQLNLLDSHDTRRFLTMVGEHLPTMQLAVTLMFTYPGVPCVYYGDEIGLTGDNDPYNRACMDWDESNWNQPLWHYYQQLIRIRQEWPVLQRGGYIGLFAERDGFAFARIDSRHCCLVALNRHRCDAVTFSAATLARLFTLSDWHPLIGGGACLQASGQDLSVYLPPCTAAIWVADLAPMDSGEEKIAEMR